jgi:hypothetical protein
MWANSLNLSGDDGLTVMRCQSRKRNQRQCPGV